MTITSTQLFSQLSEKVGSEVAESLITYVDEKAEKQVAEKISHLATKEELERGLKEVERSISTHFRWVIGIIMIMFAAIIGLYFK